MNSDLMLSPDINITSGGGDIREKNIKEANDYAKQIDRKNIKFYLCDVTKKIPKELSEKKFDLIIFSEVIEHLPYEKQRRVIISLMNLLGKGGVLALTTPNKNSPLRRLYRRFGNMEESKKYFSQLSEEKIEQDEGFGHIGLLKKKEIKNLFKNYNIKIRGICSTYGNYKIDSNNFILCSWIISHSLVRYLPSLAYDFLVIATNA